MAAHSNSTTPHRPYRWVVANATARAALTNSPEPGETSLVSKILLQSDTRDIYELVDDAPMTWKLIMPGFESASDDDVLTIVSGAPAWAAGGGGGGGADGKTVLNGSGAPSNALGTNGDFYYDPTAKVMYGPKSGGVWPSGVSLQGPAGADGADGASGTNGTNGADGAPGSVWRDGTGVPSNSLGVNGDYYLNDANGDVYLRSAGTYSVVANIKGPAGADGSPGASGTPGDPGANGADGADGADGSTLLSGYGVPGSGLGVNGDYYWNLLTADVYSKAGGSWTLVGNINKYRSPTFTRTSGLVSSVSYADGSTKTITRSGGVITQIDFVASGKTSRRVITRTSGVITSITDSEF